MIFLKIIRLSFFGGFLTLICNQVFAHEPSSLNQKETNFVPNIIGNSAYLSPMLQEDLFFNVFDYIKKNHSYLNAHAEAISHWSGYYIVNPKLVITAIILGIREHSGQTTLSAPLVRNFFSAHFNGMETQASIKLIVERSRQHLDARRFNQGEPNKNPNQTRFDRLYSDLFGNLKTANQLTTTGAAFNISRDANGNLKPVQDILIQWPFKRGRNDWYMGGYHVQAAINSNRICTDARPGWCAFAAQDFTLETNFSVGYPGTRGNANAKIHASISGPIQRLSSCEYVQYSPDGKWLIQYYHMNSEDRFIPIGSTTYYAKNSQFGFYADQLQEALCGGGGSTAPHVHWSIYHKAEDGFYDPVDLKYIVVSGWSNKTTFSNQSYSNNCTLFFAYDFDNNATRQCPYQTSRNISNPLNLDTDGDCVVDEQDNAFLNRNVPLSGGVCSNSAPVINSLATPQKYKIGDQIDIQITATDPNGHALSFSAANLPTGISINSNGRIRGRLTSKGEFNSIITVSDGFLQNSVAVKWIINPNIAYIIQFLLLRNL